MLHQFLVSNHDEIVTRTRRRVAARLAPRVTAAELENGIPVFLSQLGDALQLAQSQSSDVPPQSGAIEMSASRHGKDLLRLGLTVGQVVHDYGDVCQVVTELAVEQNASITPEEFRTLNLCLDNAIAGAVTAYGRMRERTMAKEETERLGTFSHEVRNLVNIALLSFESIKQGVVGATGTTGAMHGRALVRLRDLIDRSLVEVRLDSGVIQKLAPIEVAAFIEEVEIGASIEARSRGVRLVVGPIEETLAILGDRQTLAAALTNVLQNAFKFTHKDGEVTLTILGTDDRVLFQVEDQCGGIPNGQAETLFRPFEQRGIDRSGIGLGLSIAAKAVKANQGEIRVVDLPGQGCIFTIDIPRLKKLN